MDTPAWVSDAIFYQIFPDRFAKSDRLLQTGMNFEPWDSPPTVHGIKGGDLLGVVEHLDYLQDLGVNALYFTPVFTSASNHRYHTYDYYSVDPILGGNRALRELLDGAHRRGMRVVLDGVFNHASRGFWQFHHTLENGSASPLRRLVSFRSRSLERQETLGSISIAARAAADPGGGQPEGHRLPGLVESPSPPEVQYEFASRP